MVIAIDGPSGSGKSTIAKFLAEKLSDLLKKEFTYINSGKLYRTITLACLREKIDLNEPKKVINFAKKLNISYQKTKVYLNNEDVTDLLHTDEIDRYSAPFSAIVPVRHIVNDMIRITAKGQNIVVEGRDMTTVVFPKADYRFFVDASADVRAKRRYDQGVSNLSLQEIKIAIMQRDEIDKHKKEGSLKIGKGVHYIDTSDLTIIEVYEKLIEKIER